MGNTIKEEICYALELKGLSLIESQYEYPTLNRKNEIKDFIEICKYNDALLYLVSDLYASIGEKQKSKIADNVFRLSILKATSA